MDRLCRVCKQLKSVEHFGRLHDGFTYECKPCKKEIDRKYREKNKEKISKRKKEAYRINPDPIKRRSSLWYKENRDKAIAFAKAYVARRRDQTSINKKSWYLRNRDAVMRRSAAYYIANSGRCLAVCAEWRARNRQRIKENYVKYYKENKPRYYAHAYKRRARVFNAPGCFARSEINELLIKQRYKCACCRISIKNGFHRDHVIALSRGGSNFISNIQLLCRSCNCRKSTKDPIVFMQQNGYLL